MMLYKLIVEVDFEPDLGYFGAVIDTDADKVIHLTNANSTPEGAEWEARRWIETQLAARAAS